MKKNIYLLIFITIILSTTACSNKKSLTCTKNVDSDGANINNINTLVFKDDKISTMNMQYVYKLDKEYTSSATSIKKSIDKQFSEYSQYDGVEYTSSINGQNTEIKYIIKIDINKINKSAKEKFGITGAETYDANKKALEEAGFSCK